MQFNSIEVYEDTARKMARAQNHNDAALVRHHREWLNRALALEEPDYRRQARAAFDEAYRQTRNITPNQRMR